MTHEELLQKLTPARYIIKDEVVAQLNALRAVVELHKPWEDTWPTSGNLRLRCGAPDCTDGFTDYPCLTIQAIEKELK